MESEALRLMILERLEELEAVRYRCVLTFQDAGGNRREAHTRVQRLLRSAEGAEVLTESGERIPVDAIRQVDGWPKDPVC